MFAACDSEFFLLNGHCVTMLTKYAFSNHSDDVTPDDVTLLEAMSMCRDVGAVVPRSLDFDKVQMYLSIWNHTKDFGLVLVSSEGNDCLVLDVSDE